MPWDTGILQSTMDKIVLLCHINNHTHVNQVSLYLCFIYVPYVIIIECLVLNESNYIVKLVAKPDKTLESDVKKISHLLTLPFHC